MVSEILQTRTFLLGTPRHSAELDREHFGDLVYASWPQRQQQLCHCETEHSLRVPRPSDILSQPPRCTLCSPQNQRSASSQLLGELCQSASFVRLPRS